MQALCLPEAFPGYARRTVLPISPQSSTPDQLPFYKVSQHLNPLESTLPNAVASVHSKRLTPSIDSFRINTYEKQGEGVPSSSPKVCQLVTTRDSAKPGTTDTLTPPLSPIVSYACAHFPSPTGVGCVTPCQISKFSFGHAERGRHESRPYKVKNRTGRSACATG